MLDDEFTDDSWETDALLSGTVTLGRDLGRPVHVGVHRKPPDAPAPDQFGVNVFVTGPDGEPVDVVRVDTFHAGCHVDRCYLPTDHPRVRDYGPTFFSPEDAVAWLVEDERWRDFLGRYDANHGLPPRPTADGDDEE